MSIGSARKSYQNEDKCLLQSHTWQARLMILQLLGGGGGKMLSFAPQNIVGEYESVFR